MINWKNLLAWFAARADEPSTYAGLAALAAAAGVHFNQGLALNVGVALAGVLSVILSEKKV